MRKREEIEDDAIGAIGPHKSERLLELILEVMLVSLELLRERELD